MKRCGASVCVNRNSNVERKCSEIAASNGVKQGYYIISNSQGVQADNFSPTEKELCVLYQKIKMILEKLSFGPELSRLQK